MPCNTCTQSSGRAVSYLPSKCRRWFDQWMFFITPVPELTRSLNYYPPARVKRFLVAEVRKCPHISILLKVEVVWYFSVCILKRWIFKTNNTATKETSLIFFGYKTTWIWDGVIKLWCSHIHQETNEQTGSEKRFLSVCPQRLCQTGFLLPLFEKYECYIYYFYPHYFKDTMHPSTQFHIDISVTHYKWIWLKKLALKHDNDLI